MFRIINHKVPSFSLIEMLVVLLLSSMIVTIIYYSYYTVTTYQHTLVNRHAHFADQRHVYFLLKRDFERSHSIQTFDGNGLSCSINDSTLTVQYYFDPSFVIRKQQGQPDTFFCKTSQVAMFWKGEVLAPGSHKIDELKFTMEGIPDSLELVFHKDYDRASLIETVKDTLP